jgi:ankyrin repeat protein
MLGYVLGAIIGIIINYFFIKRGKNHQHLFILLGIILLATSISRIYIGSRIIPPLISAAKHNNLVYVKLVSIVSSEFDVRDINGATPLIKSCEFDNVELVKELVHLGASLDAQDNRGWNALMVAIYGRGVKNTGSFDIANFLIRSGANLNAKTSHGKTALMLAIKVDATTIAQQLIAKGADLHMLDNSGRNALIYAAKYGNLKIVKMLINSGLDLRHADTNGYTAFDYAKQASLNSNDLDDYENIAELLRVN